MQLEFCSPVPAQLLPFPAIPKDISRMETHGTLRAQAAGEQPGLTSLLCTKISIYEHLKDHFPAPLSVTHMHTQPGTQDGSLHLNQTEHRVTGAETGTEQCSRCWMKFQIQTNLQELCFRGHRKILISKHNSHQHSRVRLREGFDEVSRVFGDSVMPFQPHGTSRVGVGWSKGW